MAHLSHITQTCTILVLAFATGFSFRRKNCNTVYNISLIAKTEVEFNLICFLLIQKSDKFSLVIILLIKYLPVLFFNVKNKLYFLSSTSSMLAHYRHYTHAILIYTLRYFTNWTPHSRERKLNNIDRSLSSICTRRPAYGVAFT